MTRVFEITSIDTGKTRRLTEPQARKLFGRDEWQEIKAGYLPHLAVMDVTEDA